MDSVMPKELWCFNCNCTISVCIHNSCPKHCDMCTRIREIMLKTTGLPMSVPNVPSNTDLIDNQ